MGRDCTHLRIAAIVFLPALCRWLLRPREKDTFKPEL